MRHTIHTGVRATSLAAAVVACLTSMSVQAANTAQMQDIKLYGEVTIAQDSVQSWGPWEQFEAPAAGNRLPLPTFASDASNLYRPISPVTPPDEKPPVTPPVEITPHTLIGYGTFVTDQVIVESTSDRARALFVSETPLTDRTSASIAGTVPGTAGMVTGTGTFTPILSTTSLPVSQTSNLPFDNAAPIQAYAFGQQEGPARLYGAVGIRTSSSDIASLVAGNKTLSYSGQSLIDNWTVNMTIQFGSGKVSGSLQYAQGGPIVSLAYSGTIKGSDITAKIGGGGSGATGAIAATTVGPNAAAVVGGYNATTRDGVRHTDTFLATQKVTAPK